MVKQTKAIIVFWGIEKDNSKNLAYRAQIETELALLAAGENPKEYLIKHVEWNHIFSKKWQSKVRGILVNLLPVPTPVRTFLGDYVGDVLDFFLNHERRDEAQNLYLNILAEIEAAGISFKDTIVVGYSLGSLISANAMRERREAFKAYIHLASPLGCSIRAVGSLCRRFFGEDVYTASLFSKHLISMYSPKDIISGEWYFPAASIYTQLKNPTAKHEEYQKYLTDALSVIKNEEQSL